MARGVRGKMGSTKLSITKASKNGISKGPVKTAKSSKTPAKESVKSDPKITPKKRKINENKKSGSKSSVAVKKFKISDSTSTVSADGSEDVEEEEKESQISFKNRKTTSARILEDDNYVDMSATDDYVEFPSDEEGSSDDEEETEELQDQNNNAMECPSQVQESEDGELMADEDEQGVSKINHSQSSGGSQPGLKQAFNLMQDFMLHKGLIDGDFLNEDDMNGFILGASGWKHHNENLKKTHVKARRKEALTTRDSAGTKQQV